MIKASSINALIQKAKFLKQEIPSVETVWTKLVDTKNLQLYDNKEEDLSSLRQKLQTSAQNLGFKKGYFKEAYHLPKTFLNYDKAMIKSFNIPLLHIKKHYLGYAHIAKKDYTKALEYDFVQSLSLKALFEKQMQEQMQSIIFLGLLSLVVIFLLLFFITQKSLLYALSFLLFPMAMVAIYGYFIALNILHIFMLFIIVAISIDYAIYLSNEADRRTKQAIHYSLLSTFAGFGVLVFSSIASLYALGIIATMGIVGIFILLTILQK